MYHRLFLILFILVSTFACSKKRDGSSNFYFRFKADGNQREFTATSAYLQGTGNLSINGGTNDGSGNAFTINIVSPNSTIQANVDYNVEEGTTSGYIPVCYLNYSLNNPAAYIYGSWIPLENKVYNSYIRISEMDDSHVKGIFHGKIREINGQSFITITEGEFNVEMQ